MPPLPAQSVKSTRVPHRRDRRASPAGLCEDHLDISSTKKNALSVIEELDELLALGFRGREAEKVNDMLKELNDVEDETDELGIALARALFEHEDEMKPVSVMMWYQLIEWIGDLADYAEKVGDRLRLLIAK